MFSKREFHRKFAPEEPSVGTFQFTFSCNYECSVVFVVAAVVVLFFDFSVTFLLG